MSSPVVGAISILVVLALMSLGMPIGLSLIMVGLGGLAYLTSSLDGAGIFLATKVYASLTDVFFAVIPLFVLMGVVASRSAIGRRLFDTAYKWVGQYSGGLAMATIVFSALFAAVCGSSAAASATLVKLTYPEMERHHYAPILAGGTVCVGGTLAILIPPSLGFVLYAMLTDESIGKLFIAGIIPGVLLSILFIAVIMVWTRIKPDVGPPGDHVPFKEKIASLPGTLEAMVLFALVMGGLFIGWFTPSEGGAVGAAGIIVIALVRKMLTRRQFLDSLAETAKTTGMMLILIAGGMFFAAFIARSQLPRAVGLFVSSLGLSPMGVIILIIIIYLILGCVMELNAMVLVTIPIFYPLIISLGFNGIWFGVMVIVLMEIGMITPPVGMHIFIVAGLLPHVRLTELFKGALVLLTADVVLIVLLLVFPQIALFLPGLMK